MFAKEAGVAVNQNPDSAEIVHVGRSAPASSLISPQSISDLLGIHPCVRGETDVYRALANLLQRGTSGVGFARPVTAVIACVDGLSDAELEFFRLLRAARPDVQVMAYSATGSDIAVERALQAGAQTTATVQLVHDLLRSSSPAPMEIARDLPEIGPPLAQPPPVRASQLAAGPLSANESDTRAAFEVAPKPHEPEHPDDEEADGSVDDGVGVFDETEDDESLEPDPDESEAARVPWLKYNDRPVRMGPGIRIPPAGPPRTPPENGATHPETSHVKPLTPPPVIRPGGSVPLLSEEELRALLEDDVSALAPREKGSTPDEKRLQGR